MKSEANVLGDGGGPKHVRSPDGPQLGVLLLDPPLRHHLPLRLALLAERARLPEAARQTACQRRD